MEMTEREMREYQIWRHAEIAAGVRRAALDAALITEEEERWLRVHQSGILPRQMREVD